MIKFPRVRLKCAKCGGMKCVGEEFHLFGELWVDVTCINCAHTADIRVEDFNKLMEKLEKYMK